MKEFEIWCEGFCATGERGRAHLMGREKGKNFKDASIKFFSKKNTKRTICNNLEVDDYDPKRNTYWACSLYDNETDARRSFG